MKNNVHQIAYLRPEEILLIIKKTSLAYLPLGPLEWHGPHLAFGTDPLNAEKISIMAAAITGGLVFPTFYWGTERERPPESLELIGFNKDDWVVGMDFPSNSIKSLYTTEEIFAILVREQIRLMLSIGIRFIVIVSGHGASNHMAVLYRLVAEFNQRSNCQVLVLMPFPEDKDGEQHVGHADRTETALMLAHYPDTVDVKKLPAGSSKLHNTEWAIVDSDTFEGHPTPDRTVRNEYDPRLATAEEGMGVIQQVVEQVVKLVKSRFNL